MGKFNQWIAFASKPLAFAVAAFAVSVSLATDFAAYGDRLLPRVKELSVWMSTGGGDAIPWLLAVVGAVVASGAAAAAMWVRTRQAEQESALHAIEEIEMRIAGLQARREVLLLQALKEPSEKRDEAGSSASPPGTL